jgi:hypothetical protein
VQFFGARAKPVYDFSVRIVFDPTMNRLLVDVSEGIRVLQSRDGILLSEGQILERARNIVMGLVGNYRIESLEGEPDGVANSNATRAPAAAPRHVDAKVGAA